MFLKLLVKIKCSCGNCKVTLKSSDQYLAVEERAETRRLLPLCCSGVGGTLISVNKYSVGADHNWLLLRVTLQGKFFFFPPPLVFSTVSPRGQRLHQLQTRLFSLSTLLFSSAGSSSSATKIQDSSFTQSAHSFDH